MVLADSSWGVRPVAVGEVIMKLAGLVLVQRFEVTLQPLFAPIQQGVMAKSGCERVVHTLNSLYKEGSCIMSIDVKNAFNAPSRNDLARAVYGLATLRPFQRFFHAEYAAPSELLYYGHEGKHVGTILSTNGVRQGSTLSTVYFCALLQPVLETLAAKYPKVKINAYVDDITLASHNPEELTDAFLYLRELLTHQSLFVASHKCIWFGGKRKKRMPHVLRDAGVTGEDVAFKVLGAFVGDDKVVSQCLSKSLEKHNDIFRRLKRMGPSNLSCKILSKCVNVRQTYHMRVHNPAASENSAEGFDTETEKVVESWFGELNEEQMSLIRMPTKKGGLGLTACATTRRAAYESSRYSVLEQQVNNSARTDNLEIQSAHDQQHTNIPPNDTTTTAAQIHSRTWKKLTSGTSDMSKILEKVAFKGNSEWVLSDTKLIPPHLFRLAIMPRLGIAHPDLPSHIICPGCKILLNSDNMIRHITGCSKCAGLNATVKHSTLVNFLYELCLKAGIPCEKEPRTFSTLRCTQCNEMVEPNHKRTHERACGGRSFRRSGPDLVIYWASGEIHYDLTVVHELAPSNLATKCAQLFREASKRKHDTYVKSGKISESSFQCIPILSGGAMHTNTQSLLSALADASGSQRQQIKSEFQVLLQELNGAVAYSQLRKYISRDRKESELTF